ncbi:hypothetical protein Y1Q_0016635 [Alligator mississippiensis]|uniref:Uncharacterized protein n=1 Tax=Alligator mississippiensis TaxID=8496 RepID=A0A151P6Z1_ALLMI|nr:hypothetical protein Y1Q_0016635 [Alligator mississippiensis]
MAAVPPQDHPGRVPVGGCCLGDTTAAVERSTAPSSHQLRDRSACWQLTLPTAAREAAIMVAKENICIVA